MDNSSAPNWEGFFLILIFLLGLPLIQILHLRRMTIRRRAFFMGTGFWVLMIGALLIDSIFGQNIWGAGWQFGIGAAIGITILTVGIIRYYAWGLEWVKRTPKEKQPLWAKTLGFYDPLPKDQDSQKKDQADD